jgi:hypothetical protein
MIWAIAAACVVLVVLATYAFVRQVNERAAGLEAEKLARSFEVEAIKQAAVKKQRIEQQAQTDQAELQDADNAELERLVNE